MSEVFGEFIEPTEENESLIISFSLSNVSVQNQWHNSSLLSDFLAKYWGTFLSVNNNVSKVCKSEMEDVISYVSNELLENAIKYSNNTLLIPIELGTFLTQSSLSIYVKNSIESENERNMKETFLSLLEGDTEEMFFQQVESNVGERSSSGLGLLTLINDYHVNLAWKIENIQSAEEVLLLTTMAQLPSLTDCNMIDNIDRRG